MSEGLWVIVGVLLGFAGTYLLQRLAEKRRKKQLRTVARNIIGLEIIHNLKGIEWIEKAITKTIEDTSLLVYQATIPPRSEVFNRLLDLSSLSVLDEVEQRLFVEVFSQLNLVAREFALWPEEIHKAPPNRKARETASKNLSTYVGYLRVNLVQLLCEICLRGREGLQDKRLRDIYEKLQSFENTQSGRDGKSSDYRSVYESEKTKLKRLVVWEDDWPECPLEILELRAICSGKNS